MGRTKSYDRETLSEKAMNLFRDHGFAGTSAEMLAERLGVNRYSIYAEFGSKQGLFDAALDRYDQTVLGPSFGPLEAPGAGIDEIRALFEFYGSAGTGPASGRGCLLCNTAIEFGKNDPGGAGFVERYFERLTGAFFASLTSARDLGEVGDSIDLGEEANFLTALVLGLFVLIRAKAPSTTIQGAALVAINHLDALGR
jgi:TetR/AcrR family transcriptional repressor of nem operon